MNLSQLSKNHQAIMAVSLVVVIVGLVTVGLLMQRSLLAINQPESTQVAAVAASAEQTGQVLGDTTLPLDDQPVNPLKGLYTNPFAK